MGTYGSRFGVAIRIRSISAIDSELPKPPERIHLMLGSRASWVDPDIVPRDQVFEEYPEESIAAWHQRLELEERDV